jgi:hypothetical protein
LHGTSARLQKGEWKQAREKRRRSREKRKKESAPKFDATLVWVVEFKNQKLRFEIRESCESVNVHENIKCEI